jgi:hypothetical protein
MERGIHRYMVIRQGNTSKMDVFRKESHVLQKRKRCSHCFGYLQKEATTRFQ